MSVCHRLVLAAAVSVAVAGVAVATRLGSAPPPPPAAPAAPAPATTAEAEAHDLSTTLTTAAPDPVAPPPPPPDERFVAALGSIWRDSQGGCLRVTAGDRVLFDGNPDAPVVPASTAKLFAGAAALRLLGPDARLRTTVRAVTVPGDGVVTGDLWLVGGGDPVLGTDAWAAQLDPERRVYTSLDVLADRLVAAGVRRVDGRIIGDESRYDGERYVDTWPARLIRDGEAGPLSALSVNDGFRTWGHPGVPFTDPPTDAAEIFAQLLTARGVTVAAAGAAGTAPRGAVELAGIDSPAVGELVHAMLRDSDNGTAELLVKELGLTRSGAGTTAAGTRVVRGILLDAGVGLAGVTVADGSGLSDAARVTCRSLTTVLARNVEALSDRLAVAGSTGTLARRFVGTPAADRIRAKTGSLEGTAALAGYARTASGATVEFAYIVSGPSPAASHRSFQDRLALALVTSKP